VGGLILPVSLPAAMVSGQEFRRSKVKIVDKVNKYKILGKIFS
jgi:hypothetical protein